MNKTLLRLLAAGSAVTIAAMTPALVSLSHANALTGALMQLSQSSVGEAEALLQEALARLERAKNEGGDVAAAQAEVDAANAAVEALKQADAQRAADEEAAKAAEAQKAAEAEAAKAAEAEAAAKAAEAEAAAKAAADAEAAKAAEAEAAAKAAADAEAAKAAEAEAAAKAAEAEAAAKAAADAEAAKAAEAEAAKQAAPAEAAPGAPAEPAPAPAEQAPAPAPVEPAPAAPAEPAPAPTEPTAPAPAEPAPATGVTEPAAPAPAEAAPAEPAPAAPAEAAPVEPAPAAPADPAASAPAEPAAPAPAEPAPATGVTEPAAPAEAAPAAPAPAVDAFIEKLPDPLPENAAPVLDSAKEAPAAPAAGVEAAPAPAEPATPAPPAPITDAAAQVGIAPVKIESATIETGERLSTLPAPEPTKDIDVVKVIDSRTIINIGAQIFVSSPDTPRLVHEDDEVIVERLPRGRTRETIIRENGVQVVTIRNRYGDIIQRSRILPDGREVILAYTPEYDTEENYVWRDPGLDLPPLRLTVPIRDYILSVSLIEDQPEEYDEEVVYYDFLEKPPVEIVERTYSVDEVKRSARVRDKVRRIDLDTITFAFGSADIKEDQIQKLESVAGAMLKLLEKNPAETFLIEGHTDAVGTDQANLVLSDRRAESIAAALSNAFDVPSENLTTQGYGERYLKVKTTKPEELNRRVAIRRITSLVAPVALK
ncbi:MAG: OmpA family protein [Rhizobiaceae bacterium]